jgi:transposase
MANQTIPMAKIRQILRYYSQGKSKLQIAEQTGVSRNTLKKYIHRFHQEALTLEQIESLSDHELDILFGQAPVTHIDKRYEDLLKILPLLEKEMKRKGMTLQRVLEQYIQQYPDGYLKSQFHYHYSEYTKRPEPVMRIQHKAGDKIYIDFAGDKLSIVDQDTGEVKEVEVFIAILGCSQLTYVEAVGSQKKEDLIKACENALHYIGGVPLAVVPDNLKSAVTKSSRYEPVINEAFAGFAEHYSMTVLPARAYKPRDKALVEGMVKIVYRRIYTALSQQIHHSLESLNHSIWIALEQLNNAPFKGKDYSRRQQFEDIEKSYLQALPLLRYENRQQSVVTVMKNGHVCLGADKHYYSVPYSYIGKKVKLLFNTLDVEIYSRYECIASHLRDLRKYQYTTVTEHLASAHRYITDWTPEHFIEQANVIHADVALYISKVLEHKNHPEQAYKSCSGILNLARKAGKERLINACRRAQHYGIYNYPIIMEILDRKMDLIKEEENSQGSMPEHDNIRGENYYQ